MFNKINTEISGRAALLLMADAAGSLTPEARANATAATLTEAAGLPGMCEATITAADLLVGLLVIWSHYAAEYPTLPAEVAAPRKARARTRTLREIGEHLCGSAGCPPPSEDWHTAIARCRKVWEIVARDFPGDYPRACSIRETWSREAAYLTE